MTDNSPHLQAANQNVIFHLRDHNNKATSCPLVLCSKSSPAASAVLLQLSLQNKGVMLCGPLGAGISPTHPLQHSPDGRAHRLQQVTNHLVS